MTISMDEFKRLKTKAEQCAKDASRAEGAYEESLKRLEELGYESITEAEAALADLTVELKEAEQEYEQELGEFKAKWGDLLDD